MSIPLVVLIRTNTLTQSYVDALSRIDISIELIEAEKFIAHTEKLPSTTLVVIETSSPDVVPILKLNKKNMVTTLLILDNGFLHRDIQNNDVGALVFLPFELSPSSLVEYISIINRNRKTLIARDIVGSEKNRLINIAVGILVANIGCSCDDAYNRIRQTARKNRTKIEIISKEILEAQMCQNRFSCEHFKDFTNFNTDKNI